VICDVADAGKPLFTERPLAPQFDTVGEIVDVVERADIPTQVGFEVEDTVALTIEHESGSSATW
jgi:predicted dehydrogenase